MWPLHLASFNIYSNTRRSNYRYSEQRQNRWDDELEESREDIDNEG